MPHIRSLTALLAVSLIAADGGAQTCPGNDGFEPNETCAQAVPVGAGSLSGLALVAGDNDMWAIDVGPGETVVIDILFTHASGNIDAKLVTADCANAIDYSTSTDDDEQVSGTNGANVAVTWVVHLFGSGAGFVCNDYELVVGAPVSGASYCFGDGSGASCPCGNLGGGGEGCANSTGAGATLAATGSGSVGADDLAFDAAGLLPGQPALLFVGENQTGGGAGLPFGDGLRCAGSNVVRLGVETPDAGGAAGWGPGLGASGGWSSGDVRRFQVWYRDPLGGPCGSGFNLSPGFEVVFGA